MKRSLKIFMISALTFMICGAPTIRFQAIRPALINVPNYIESIGLIDRSEVPKTISTTIEKVITAEMPGESKVASQFAIDGFANFLHNSQRFTIIRSGLRLTKEARANMFPDPLSWDEVEAICKELNVDAIVSLEIFNSDFIIPVNTARVTVGFRFYDLPGKRIFDQEQFRHEMIMGKRITSGIEAIGLMIDKDRAIKDASYEAGAMYARRISPTWYTIQREYYRKPKRNQYLRMGSRMMEANDWDRAIENLSKAVETGRRRIQGRAAHNLAVVYEILGDLETSKKWAQEAWGMYRNKGSKNYSFILSQRTSELRVLEYQELE